MANKKTKSDSFQDFVEGISNDYRDDTIQQNEVMAIEELKRDFKKIRYYNKGIDIESL